MEIQLFYWRTQNENSFMKIFWNKLFGIFVVVVVVCLQLKMTHNGWMEFFSFSSSSFILVHLIDIKGECKDLKMWWRIRIREAKQTFLETKESWEKERNSIFITFCSGFFCFISHAFLFRYHTKQTKLYTTEKKKKKKTRKRQWKFYFFWQKGKNFLRLIRFHCASLKERKKK